MLSYKSPSCSIDIQASETFSLKGSIVTFIWKFMICLFVRFGGECVRFFVHIEVASQPVIQAPCLV